MLTLVPITKSDTDLRDLMAVHYSQPLGFVGRQLIYRIEYAGWAYGAIAAGSATRFLPGRSEFFDGAPLDNIINNTFFHCEKIGGYYPVREFMPLIVKAWRQRVSEDWRNKYGDDVAGFETLVELPRTGELYLRDGWEEVGQTKGYTCKRTAGKGTDSWSGRRVWDTENLRPKRVFVRRIT